jgi:predicted aspartyl protease
MNSCFQSKAERPGKARKVAALCVALLAGLSTRGAARAADTDPCSLQRVAELPVKSDGARLLIQVKIEGRDAWFQVDTGSPVSLITSQLADVLNLRKSSIASGRLLDAAGKNFEHYVRIKTLTLNDMTAENLTLVVMGETGSDKQWPYDGVFGANFLAAYDVELDIPHGKMSLYVHNRCKEPPVYWTQDFVSLPFFLDASLHMVMTATLDGKPVRAMIDTGARPSVLSLQTARRIFDIDPEAAGRKPDGEGRAGSGAPLIFYKQHFDVLDIGGVSFRNTELYLVPDKTSRGIDENRSYEATLPSETNQKTPLAIGMRHLARIRAYIAYDSRTIYISAADAH